METNNQQAPTFMSEIEAQKNVVSSTEAQGRALYFNSANAFMRKLPRVPDALFDDPPAQALADEGPTAVFNCDSSEQMGESSPCTTPHLLARYIRIRASDSLDIELNATGVVFYAIKGSGVTQQDGEVVAWNEGDIFVLPGGMSAEIKAREEGAVLWAVGDEPYMNFQGVRPDANQKSTRTKIVHFPASEIDGQINFIYGFQQEESTAARAIIFSSDEQFESRNILPTLTLALNSLDPGASQQAHRHNSAAVTLIIQGGDCYSTIDGVKKPWLKWATTVTPPGALHSHSNLGDKRALFLIVQDGGLYTHARASGFSFS